MSSSWMWPQWPQGSRARAVMTTRAAGDSRPPFDAFNLGLHVGDDPAVVEAHRRLFARTMQAEPVFLEQVHGTRVVRVGRADASAQPPLQADAAVTTEPGVACVVMVADCLPVLLAADGDLGVAAAHAGWRGLCAGVLETTVQALCEAAGCSPQQLQAWLGPCIGPRRFEVGDEVRAAFEAVSPQARMHFRAQPVAAGPAKWLADLPALARQRLAASGVTRVQDSGACTVEDPSRFFSFRRDGRTGRMAAAVWLADGGS